MPFVNFFAIEQAQREAAEQAKKAANNETTGQVVNEKPVESEPSQTDVPVISESVEQQPSVMEENVKQDDVSEVQESVVESKTDNNNTVESFDKNTEPINETKDSVAEEFIEKPAEEVIVEQRQVKEQTVTSEDVVLADSSNISEPVRQKSVADMTTKVSKRSQAKPPVTKPGPKFTSSTVQVQNFPRELMDAVREQVPGSTNNSDALAAFVYFKLGQPELVVPQKIKDLASKCEGDHQVENIALRLESMEQQMRGFGSIMQELELGIAYFIFDRLGFRRNTPKDARSIDFLENGVLDTRDRLREMQSQVRKRDLLKKGRPIR